MISLEIFTISLRNNFDKSQRLAEAVLGPGSKKSLVSQLTEIDRDCSYVNSLHIMTVQCTYSGVASPLSTSRTASIMFGTSSRLTINPGVSLQATHVLPIALPQSIIALKVSSDVSAMRITFN